MSATLFFEIDFSSKESELATFCNAWAAGESMPEMARQVQEELETLFAEMATFTVS